MTVHVAEPFVDLSGEQPVRGFLHRPISPSGIGIVLTHGASGNSQSSLLVGLGTAFSAAGVMVLRCDLPFRQLRPKGPPSPSGSARDREGLKDAVSALRRLVIGKLYLGGQSYGCRQASILAASESSLISGLLLLSYPLHPPGRPNQQRTVHFPSLRTPALFVSGTKDAFGSVEELETAIKLISARTQFVQIPNAGHGLVTKKNASSLPETIVEAFTAMFF